MIGRLVLASKKAAGPEMDVIVAAGMNLSTDGMTYLALHCKRAEVTLLENPMALQHLPEQARRDGSLASLLGLAAIIMCSKTSPRPSRIRPVQSWRRMPGALGEWTCSLGRRTWQRRPS